MLMVMLIVGGATACSSNGGNAEAVGRSTDALCSSATLTSSAPTYTAAPGQTVIWTGSGSCAATAQYAFNLRGTNGVFTRIQDWSPSPQWTWDTTGLPTGQYYVEVLISDASGTPTTYDRFASAYFDLTTSQLSEGPSRLPARQRGAGRRSTASSTSTRTGLPSKRARIRLRIPPGPGTQAWAGRPARQGTTTSKCGSARWALPRVMTHISPFPIHCWRRRRARGDQLPCRRRTQQRLARTSRLPARRPGAEPRNTALSTSIRTERLSRRAHTRPPMPPGPGTRAKEARQMPQELTTSKCGCVRWDRRKPMRRIALPIIRCSRLHLARARLSRFRR